VSAEVVVIGGGPAGLMAAEVLVAGGLKVTLCDQMASVGRKVLIAGKGGLNLTHSEPLPAFIGRYREAADWIAPMLERFGPQAVRDFAAGLGIDTIIGSSARVFPADLKAAPLLRRWVARLKAQGVEFRVRHRWTGWTADGALGFDSPDGPITLRPAATILALGGASWPELGADAGWVPFLAARGVPVEAFQPSNCGFTVAWAPDFATRHAGAPLKSVVGHWIETDGKPVARRGELVITAHGIEGSLIYAASAALRKTLLRDGRAVLTLDLAPDRSLASLVKALAAPRGKRSKSEWLRRASGLDGLRLDLFKALTPREILEDPVAVAGALKALPVPLEGMRPIAEAISSAGGLRLEALDGGLQLRAVPGVWACGEMLDWDAPTGGYLLTGCFATGWWAGMGVRGWLGVDGGSGGA